MEKVILSLGAVGAALLVLWRVLAGGRSDAALARLKREDRTKEAQEIGALTQEIKDAKLDYKTARERYDDLVKRNDSTEP